jgi:hypothetical protein
MAVYTLVLRVLMKAFQIEHYALFVLTGLVDRVLSVPRCRCRA